MRLFVSELKHETTFPDEDGLEDKEILEVANLLLDNFDDLDTFLDAFSSNDFSESVDVDLDESNKMNEFDSLMCDRLQKELEALRSQHEFECEYVDQLEKEIICVTNDRDCQISELTIQIKQLQSQNASSDVSLQLLKTECEKTQLLLKESNKTLDMVRIELLEVITQRDQFKEKLVQYLSNQDQLHDGLLGSENQYARNLTREQKLEREIEELQNYVLQQASKASEYEAAVQHWKEQSVRHQNHALQLSGALERLLDEKPIKHLTPLVHTLHDSEHDCDSIADITEPIELPTDNAPKLFSRASSKVDLPFFLVNRH